MQVKIFESTDMTSGLKLVKDTLGPDALILSTRTIRNGKLGILGKPTLEITAAIDSPWPEAQEGYQSQARIAVSPRKKAFTQWADDTVMPKPSAPQGQAITYDSQFRLHPEPVRSQEIPTEIHKEMDELKEMVKKLGMEMAQLGKVHKSTDTAPFSQQEPLTTDAMPEPQDLDQENNFSGHQQSEAISDDAVVNTTQLLALLTAQGISETAAQEISASTLTMLPPNEQWSNTETQQGLLRACISSHLHVSPQPLARKNGQHRLALVGPTGVGKTTTLAKIAAHYLSTVSSSIALITIDTYRIAAVEQLKVYGAIMNLPVEVVITPEQLEQALARHHDKELILIDTAGRSPRDTLCIEELASFLRPDLAIDKHLVLSATTRRSELFEAVKRFDGLGIDQAIITKTDECSTLGILLDIQMHNPSRVIPFSWITNGQRVPEDLLAASRELMTNMILSTTPIVPEHILSHNHNTTTSKQ
jgi:flagellar biosynthesis protein FlhF